MMDKSPGVRSTDRSLLIRRNRGFSLVEVMMSVVLLAIGTAIAIPSFTDQVEKRQVTNGAEQLASFVNMAQGAAIKSNSIVSVSWEFTDSNDWCIGAVEGDLACNCKITSEESDYYCEVGSQKFVLDNSIASDRSLMYQIEGDGAYAFDPVRGLFTDLEDSLTMELHSRSGDFRLKMMVNSVGRVTLCSADAEHAVPGYAVCPPALQIDGGGIPIGIGEEPIVIVEEPQ